MGIVNYFNGVRNRRKMRSAGIYTNLAAFPIANGSQGFALANDTEILYADIDGVWVDISGAGGGLSGSGAAGRVAFWNGASSLTSDADFLYNSTTKELSIVTAASLVGTPMGRFRNTNLNSLAFFAVQNDVTGQTFGLSATGTNYVTAFGVQNKAILSATSGFDVLRIVTNGDIPDNGVMPFVVQPGGFSDFGMLYVDRNVLRFGRFGTAANQVTILNTGEMAFGKFTPVSCAALDMTGWTNKGFLPPKVTTTERDAIASPVAGLVVYNTTTNVLNFYNGTAWAAV